MGNKGLRDDLPSRLGILQVIVAVSLYGFGSFTLVVMGLPDNQEATSERTALVVAADPREPLKTAHRAKAVVKTIIRHVQRYGRGKRECCEHAKVV